MIHESFGILRMCEKSEFFVECRNQDVDFNVCSQTTFLTEHGFHRLVE